VFGGFRDIFLYFLSKETMNLLEGLDVWICSFGGCGSNTLYQFLKNEGFSVENRYYHSTLCHFPRPIETDTPTIYLYRNIEKAWISQKNRGQTIFDINQEKLLRKRDVVHSDENMLRAMLRQARRWSTEIGFYPRNKILFMPYEFLYHTNRTIQLAAIKAIASFLELSSGFIREFPAGILPRDHLRTPGETNLFKNYSNTIALTEEALALVSIARNGEPLGSTVDKKKNVSDAS